VDTFKVLSRLRRYECTLYDNSDAKLDRLESDLKVDPTRYTALYIEFPGNPLLGSPNLVRIYALARQYGFAIILDDTIATSVNLDLLPYADVICTSLTKMFSGACNVMGGSIALNPKSPTTTPSHPSSRRTEPTRASRPTFS
jgi:cystathionine gamma-synthase